MRRRPISKKGWKKGGKGAGYNPCELKSDLKKRRRPISEKVERRGGKGLMFVGKTQPQVGLGISNERGFSMESSLQGISSNSSLRKQKNSSVVM